MPQDSSLVSVRLPNELRDEIDQFARISKRSRSFVVKEAVAAYMQEQRALREAIDAALVEADQGVFVSGEAVDKWLASWGTDDPLPAPEPDIFPTGDR